MYPIRNGFIAALVLIVMFGSAQDVRAQQVEEDVVYLVNGSVLRGTIIEQRPGESISIRTRDGNIFIYRMDEISRIAREPVYGFGMNNSGAKDPDTATLLSVVCAGCGQLWAGDTQRGAMILGVGLGAPILGAVISASTCTGFNCSSAPMALGLLAALGAWGYGIFDAGDSARRMNALRTSLILGPDLERLAAGDGAGLRLGMAVGF